MAMGWLLPVTWFSWQIMQAAMGHNPQEGYLNNETGELHSGRLLGIGAAFFIPFGLLPVSMIGLMIYGGTKRKLVRYETPNESTDL